MELARLPLLPRIGRRLADGIDSTLLVLMMSLSMLGLLALFSASYDVPSRVASQIVNLGVALVAMWLVAQVPPQTMMRFAIPAYVIGVALLVAVALFGAAAPLARTVLDYFMLGKVPPGMEQPTPEDEEAADEDLESGD